MQYVLKCIFWCSLIILIRVESYPENVLKYELFPILETNSVGGMTIAPHLSGSCLITVSPIKYLKKHFTCVIISDKIKVECNIGLALIRVMSFSIGCLTSS